MFRFLSDVLIVPFVFFFFLRGFLSFPFLFPPVASRSPTRNSRGAHAPQQRFFSSSSFACTINQRQRVFCERYHPAGAVDIFPFFSWRKHVLTSLWWGNRCEHFFSPFVCLRLRRCEKGSKRTLWPSSGRRKIII